MHEVTFPQWALERMTAQPFASIDPARTALIVVDLQNAFLSEESAFYVPYGRSIIPAVNCIAEAMRDAGGQVIFLRHTTSSEPRYALPDWLAEARPRLANTGDIFTPGSVSHAIHDDVVVRPGDLVVDKHRYSAMPETSSSLHIVLQERGFDTLIITGVATHACCESTARDAFMLNYRVIVVADATATYTDELQSSTLFSLASLFSDVRSTSSILNLLNQSTG